MIGVPPICQSPDGNGGESNGAGGMRRGGEAFCAGASYAGECKSFANASNNRCPNQFVLSAALAFEIIIPATSPTLVSLN